MTYARLRSQVPADVSAGRSFTAPALTARILTGRASTGDMSGPRVLGASLLLGVVAMLAEHERSLPRILKSGRLGATIERGMVSWKHDDGTQTMSILWGRSNSGGS